MRDRDDENSGRYDAHRHDSDDPVLVDRLRRPPEASASAPLASSLATVPSAGGSALVAPSGPGKPALIAFTPGNYPVGGQFLPLSVNKGKSTLVNVLNWTSEDGNSRRGIITGVASPFTQVGSDPTLSQEIGAYLRITVGTPRGSSVFWAMAPCRVPVQGSRINVDAVLAGAPFRIELINGTPTPSPINGGASWTGQLAVNFFDDEGIGEPPPALLGQALQPGNGAAGALFGGPCVARSLTFSNNNATAGVWMIVADNNAFDGSTNLHNTRGAIFVPAKSTISVGEALLGSFASGVQVFGVVDPSLGASWSEDANDVNVLCTLFGYTLQQGSS